MSLRDSTFANKINTLFHSSWMLLTALLILSSPAVFAVSANGIVVPGPYFANPDNSRFISSEKYVRAGNSSDMSAAVQVPAEATDVRFIFDGSTDYNNVAGYEHTQTGQWPKADGSHQYRVKTALAPGDYQVMAEYEVGDNWYSVTGSATAYSIDSPWAQYIIPSNGQFFRSNDRVVRLKIDDEFNQFKSMSTVINGAATTVNRSECNDKGSFVLCDVQNLGLPEGAYSAVTTIYTKANNRAENLASKSFTIDSTKPILTNLHVVNPVPVYGDSVDVSADATDGNGIKDVKFYVTAPRMGDGVCDGNGVHLVSVLGVSGSGSVYNATLDTSSLDGSYCINAIAGDVAANHSAISRIKAAFDNTAPSQPSATYKEDSGGDMVSNGGYTDSQYFTFSLTNQMSESIDHYELMYWNDILGSRFKENSPWNKKNIPSSGEYKDNFTQGEGKHYFAFRACDSAKNCSDYGAPFTIMYDNTPPTAGFVGLSTDNTSPALTGTIDDDSSSVEVIVDGLPYVATVSGGQWSIAKNIIKPLDVGIYIVTVNSTDLAGNTSSAVFSGSNALEIEPVTVAVAPTTPSPQPQATITNFSNAVSGGLLVTDTGSTNGVTSVQGVSTNNVPEDTTNESQETQEQGNTQVEGITNTGEPEAGQDNFASTGSQFNWWWLLIIAALLIIGYGIYRFASEKEEA